MTTSPMIAGRARTALGDEHAALGLYELDNLLAAHDDAADLLGTAGHAAALGRIRSAEAALLGRAEADPEAVAFAAGLAVAALAKLRREANEDFARRRTAEAAFDAVSELAARNQELAVADALRSHGVEPHYAQLANF